MSFLESDEEEVIANFRDEYNHDYLDQPENQVDLMLVKKVIYDYMIENFAESSFSDLEDTRCRDYIHELIGYEFTKLKKAVIRYFRDRILDDICDIGEVDTSINDVVNPTQIEEELSQLFRDTEEDTKDGNLNFTNICRDPKTVNKFVEDFIKNINLEDHFISSK